MASNDSGVDTSNDSNDSNFVIPNYMEFQNAFESASGQGDFALPQPLPSDGSNKQKVFPSCSHSLKMRIKSRNKARLKSVFPDVLTGSRERKLRLAACTCNLELLTKLLESGTNPNCSDELGRSSLHLAAVRGYADIVRELLKYGANPNVIDCLQNTPLHLAVLSGNSQTFNLVVRILLHGGSSVHILDRNGKNPLDLAESKLRLLRSRYKNPTLETWKIIEDMCLLITIILKYSCKQRQDIEDLAALEDRLQNLSTEEQVASEADTLLASLGKLSINK